VGYMRLGKVWVLAWVLGGVFLGGSAWAHPPKSVTLSLDAPSGRLTVQVAHGVNDPAKHHVQRISVFVGGKLAAQKEYPSQTDVNGMTDTFSVGSVPKGTVIRAEATCNIMGSATGELIAP